MVVMFVVPGEPQGKGRPRFAKRGNFVTTYTPDKTVIYENLIKCEYERHCGGYRFKDDEPLRVEIVAVCAIPKSVSKKKRHDMIHGRIRPTKKPDCDNIVKCYLDALNDVAYKDDTQVVTCAINKLYGEEPHTYVTISNIPEED